MTRAERSDSTIPYTAPCVRNLLRTMPADRLSRVHRHDFQRWPTKVVLPFRELADLISSERAGRVA